MVLTIAMSYDFIAGTVMCMGSVKGSHLTAMASHDVRTLIFMYLHPSSSYALDSDKMASLFCTLVTPALNPLIYSLHNKEVKEVWRSTWSQCFCV